MGIVKFMDWVWLKEGRWTERRLDWLMPELGKGLPEEVWWEGELVHGNRVGAWTPEGN